MIKRNASAFVDTGDGTKKMDPMLSCRVVVIKWVAQYTHITRNGAGSTLNASMGALSHADDGADHSGRISLYSIRSMQLVSILHDIILVKRRSL